MRTIHWTKDRAPRRKYRNLKEIDGIPTGYDSKREMRRHGELIVLERAGQIRNLRRQVRIELIPKCEHEQAATWLADFVYEEAPSWEEIWEDCKGARTKDYIIKRKLAWWRFGKRIRES
jgi:Protein of unknown function (DUF1064)